MDLLTKMVEHHVWLTGEMIDRADAALRRAARRADRAQRRRRRSRPSAPCSRGSSARWGCGTPRSPTPRLRLVGRGARAGRARCARRLAVEGPAYLAQVREVVEHGRLDDTFVDALCEPPAVFTYGGMIAHVLTFAAHRRTLVVLALDKHGITDLGWGDPMRLGGGAVGVAPRKHPSGSMDRVDVALSLSALAAVVIAVAALCRRSTCPHRSCWSGSVRPPRSCRSFPRCT